MATRRELSQFNINDFLKNIGMAGRREANIGLKGIQDITQRDLSRKLDALKEIAEKKYEKKKGSGLFRTLVSMIPGVGPIAALAMAVVEAEKAKRFREGQIAKVEKAPEKVSSSMGTFMEDYAQSVGSQAKSGYKGYLKDVLKAQKTASMIDIGLSAVPAVASVAPNLLQGLKEGLTAAAGATPIPVASAITKSGTGLIDALTNPLGKGKLFPKGLGAMNLDPRFPAYSKYINPFIKSISTPSPYQLLAPTVLPKLTDMLLGELEEPQFAASGKAPKLPIRQRNLYRG